MPVLKLKHLVAIRWFHWINFPLLALMIWSGLLIYWAYTPYHVGGIHFFPNWVYSTFNMDHRLAEGMALHFVIMWVFAANGIAYLLYTAVSGEWRYLLLEDPIPAGAEGHPCPVPRSGAGREAGSVRGWGPGR